LRELRVAEADCLIRRHSGRVSSLGWLRSISGTLLDDRTTSGRGTTGRFHARVVHARDRHPRAPEQLADLEDAVRASAHTTAVSSSTSVSSTRRSSPGSQFRPEPAVLERAQRLLEALGNVRPIAITSPTLCICVPRIPFVPGSFSNAHRGPS
jgi:hypothetical protein